MNLVLMMDTQFQQLGAILRIKGEMLMVGKSRPFDFTAKTQGISPGDGGLVRLEVQLMQYEKELWAQFLASMRERQGRSDQIFKIIKGEE